MQRRVVQAGIAVTSLAAWTAVARADFVLPTPHKSGPNVTIAADAVNDTLDVVSKRDRRCEPRVQRGNGTLTHDPPPQDMLDAFAVLRRPATAADAFEPELRIPFTGQVATAAEAAGPTCARSASTARSTPRTSAAEGRD